MTDVTVPFDHEKLQDTAILLLGAAEDLDLPASVVRTGGRAFLVPKEVAEKADVEFIEDNDAPDSGDVTDDVTTEPKKTAAKKAPAKKPATKKSPAKKTAAKKTATAPKVEEPKTQEPAASADDSDTKE